ncbi:hypothetical protein [Moritella viscosa]|uniref:Probable glycine dehydrogenase [decarboxylating] subunit 1-Glycine cleavage system P-protein subunit 1-Glycine decarboxylase subunit 1 n=1 Tax=Moritella viscosa TaxID=80854 RepID=A0ABY1HHB1_9GAMM|nr:hypothetical protein [Moritella viscosa]SGY98467.1 Probable glycine dehydrogenase [decarboxylating] subunit 1-Glycine cleavage system P-protein subunit 1-Glycine decarboxylase subunit 1 [Moritella viscosa]SGZ12522.1 Probable glycine dehydrogenase [decarboxylating] subunit 1-Glycine cleavage system P-protein subunit 1-Glycine decarboxylase subunit 1 [Moritella viscosa]SHO27720.1 Probable glycine dehydrogenase [decarboxylating] subunit 1-Glycine cleavage system P-protein subunit 1-Glycine decar
MKSSASFLMVLLSTSAIAAEAPKTYNSIGADFNAQVLVRHLKKLDIIYYNLMVLSMMTS